MQPPLAVITSEPNNKIFYLCLPGRELQVRFANLAGNVTGDLKIDGLEYDIGQPECVRGRAPEILYCLPPGNDRRIGWQKLGTIGIERSHTGIVLAFGGCTELAISLIDNLPDGISVHGGPLDPDAMICVGNNTMSITYRKARMADDKQT
jgi:hypothetical protein